MKALITIGKTAADTKEYAIEDPSKEAQAVFEAASSFFGQETRDPVEEEKVLNDVNTLLQSLSVRELKLELTPGERSETGFFLQYAVYPREQAPALLDRAYGSGTFFQTHGAALRREFPDLTAQFLKALQAVT